MKCLLGLIKWPEWTDRLNQPYSSQRTCAKTQKFDGRDEESDREGEKEHLPLVSKPFPQSSVGADKLRRTDSGATVQLCHLCVFHLCEKAKMPLSYYHVVTRMTSLAAHAQKLPRIHLNIKAYIDMSSR